jgi:NAD(P)-dependent dehydrogenase (short-subunit alcohol dehydrogenase family)
MTNMTHPSIDLSSKHALVTGGGSGVGAAIALALAAAGARVTIAGRRPEPLAETAGRASRIVGVEADVTDEASVERLFERARAAHGPLDVVVANAGATESAPFARTTLEAWQSNIAVNLTGVFLTFRAGLREMRERSFGRLVCIASTAGLKGYAYVAPYCAAKHGAIGLVRSLALESASSAVTVNAICPGFSETPMLERSIARIMETTGRSEAEARKSLAATNPQRRFIETEEVAGTVLWLCSDAARSVTGQAISVSGGEV